MEWFPPLGVSTGLVPYAAVAVLMVAVEIYLLVQILPRTGGPPTVTRMVIGGSALLGSAGFLLSLLDLVFYPSPDLAETGFLWGLNFMMFIPPGLWVIAIAVYRDRRIEPTGWRWPLYIASSATGAEILMGLLFSVSSPVPLFDPSSIAQSLVSVWFDWSMAAAMFALVLWVRLPARERKALALLAAGAIVTPWVASAPLLGPLLTTAVMSLAFLVFYRELRTGVDAHEERLFLLVTLAFVLMAASEWANLAIGGAIGLLVFGTLTSLVMATELAYLARRSLGLATGTPSPATEPAELPEDARRPTAAATSPTASLPPLAGP
jgi:hypothetical protein